MERCAPLLPLTGRPRHHPPRHHPPFHRRPPWESPMRAVALIAALAVLAACRPVAGSSPNATDPERLGGPGQREPETREDDPVSAPDYEEDEEYEEALPVHQYIVDDLIRGEGDAARREVGRAAACDHRLLSALSLL